MDQATVWRGLERGDAVQLQSDNQNHSHAIVEDFSADRTILWVRMRDLNERKLVLYEDGVGLLPAQCTNSLPAKPR